MASSKTAKNKRTGMSRDIRAWMQAREGTKTQRRFTSAQMCDELGFAGVKQRARARAILYGFEKRGEVADWWAYRRAQHYYIYLRGRGGSRKGNGRVCKRILKAIYVAGTFTVADIVRLGGIKKPKWADRVVRRLASNGYLQKIGRRHGAGGKGAANLWRVIDRDNFRSEFLG